MANISELIDRLVSHGIDPAEAGEIIALACVAGATTAPFRKSSGAIRTEKWREKRRHKTSQRDAAQTENEASLNVTERHKTSQCDTSSLSKKEDIEIDLGKRGGKRASQLPPDWKPDPDEWSAAAETLGSEARAVNELAKFRDHALSKGRVAKDWQAAWRNWVRRAVEYSSAGPPMAAKPLTAFQQQQAKTQDVLRKLEFAASGDSGGTSADPVLPGHQRGQPGGVRGGAGATVLALPGTPDRGGNRSG